MFVNIVGDYISAKHANKIVEQSYLFVNRTLEKRFSVQDFVVYFCHHIQLIEDQHCKIARPEGVEWKGVFDIAKFWTVHSNTVLAQRSAEWKQ